MRSIGLERIHEAAGAIYDTVVRTPLVPADLPRLAELVGACENPWEQGTQTR